MLKVVKEKDSNKDGNKKHKGFLIAIFVVLEVLAIGLIIWFLLNREEEKGNVTVVDGDDLLYVSETEEVPTISFPGFGEATVKEDAKAVPLINPEDNSVYMYYQITETVKSEDVKEFDSKEKAYEYIRNQEKVYKPRYNKEDDKYYYLVDGKESDVEVVYSISENNSGGVIVTAKSNKLLYFTNAIEPGSSINWNAFDVLSAGEHILNFIIETKDIETEENCTPVSRETKIVVEK